MVALAGGAAGPQARCCSSEAWVASSVFRMSSLASGSILGCGLRWTRRNILWSRSRGVVASASCRSPPLLGISLSSRGSDASAPFEAKARASTGHTTGTARSASPNSKSEDPRRINLRPEKDQPQAAPAHLGRTMSRTPSGAANASGIAAENSNVETMLKELLARTTTCGDTMGMTDGPGGPASSKAVGWLSRIGPARSTRSARTYRARAIRQAARGCSTCRPH